MPGLQGRFPTLRGEAVTAVVLHLPLPPNRGNARQHWAARHREDKAYQERAHLYLVARRNLKPKSPWGAVRINAHVVTTRPQDLDNATARLKPALDLLVSERWLVDDNPKVVRALTVTTETGFPEVVMTITPEGA